MAYEKQTWQTGDVVTAAKLNHMEDGIASAGGGDVFICSFWFGDSSVECDKTFEEIVQAYTDDKFLIAFDNGTLGGTSIYTSVAVGITNDVESVTFHFWEPYETQHHFGYSKITITADGITDSYQEYTLTPAT